MLRNATRTFCRVRIGLRSGACLAQMTLFRSSQLLCVAWQLAAALAAVAGHGGPHRVLPGMQNESNDELQWQRSVGMGRCPD